MSESPLNGQVSDEDSTGECKCVENASEDCSTVHQRQFAEDNCLECPSGFQGCENGNDRVIVNIMQDSTGEYKCVENASEDCSTVHQRQFAEDNGLECPSGFQGCENGNDRVTVNSMQDTQNDTDSCLSEKYQEHLLLIQKEVASMKQDICGAQEAQSELRRLEDNLEQLNKESKKQNETLDTIKNNVTEQEETIARNHSQQKAKMEDLEEKMRLANEVQGSEVFNSIAHGSMAHCNKNAHDEMERSFIETFQRLDRLERENKELKTTLDVINRGLSTVQKDYRGLNVTLVQHREEIGALDRRTSFLGESQSEPCLAASSEDSGWKRFRSRVVRFFLRSHRRSEFWTNENLQE